MAPILGHGEQVTPPETVISLHEVIWTSLAVDELEAIQAYLRPLNPSAAQEVVADLIKTGDNLEMYPLRGRPVPDGRLREVISRFAYVVRYRVEGEKVYILRIRHGARQPLGRF